MRMLRKVFLAVTNDRRREGLISTGTTVQAETRRLSGFSHIIA
jgi:hypothetical protein